MKLLEECVVLTTNIFGTHTTVLALVSHRGLYHIYAKFVPHGTGDANLGTATCLKYLKDLEWLAFHHPDIVRVWHKRYCLRRQK